MFKGQGHMSNTQPEIRHSVFELFRQCAQGMPNCELNSLLRPAFPVSITVGPEASLKAPLHEVATPNDPLTNAPPF